MLRRQALARWLASATVLAVALSPGAVWASAEKVVLAEDFSATWCADCPNARCALEIMLHEFGDQLIVAEHHLIDILDFDWSATRADLYGVGPIPHVQFDGKTCVVGAGSCSGAAAAYREVINARLAETGGVSPVGVSGVWWRDDQAITLCATFELLDPATWSDAEAYLLILEDDIAWQGSTYNHVSRAAHSEPIVLSAVGDSASVTAQFSYDPSWDLGQLECIAFLQTMSGDHEIHQSARLTPAVDFDLTLAPAVAALPNGCNLAILEGTVTNVASTADELTLSLDNQFGWYAEFLLEGAADFGADPVVRTLDPDEVLDVTLRVFSDDSLRVGTGFLVTHSANSGFQRATRARVFNCSPAILLVDDDYVSETDTLVVTALESRGYLHDRWSVYVQHLNQGPGATQLCDYDAVIWHHGWADTDLLTPQDVAALTAYLDNGGRLLLSSQDYLSTTGANDFTQNYLGLAAWSTDVGASQISGLPGDPISDGMEFAMHYPGPDADRPDDLVPNGIGTVIFENEQADRVALRADNGFARTVFLALGINALDAGAPDPNNPATLIDRALQWLLSLEGTTVPDVPPVGRGSCILSRAPNPCRLSANAAGGVTIHLEIAASESGQPVRLEILDVDGRHVRTLLDRPLPTGARILTWDGCDARGRCVESGLYYAHLRAGLARDRAKLIVIR